MHNLVPRLGDTVIFNAPTGDATARQNGAHECAAIVTRVWGDTTTVNLTIVPDFGDNHTAQRTSVQHQSTTDSAYSWRYNGEDRLTPADYVVVASKYIGSLTAPGAPAAPSGDGPAEGDGSGGVSASAEPTPDAPSSPKAVEPAAEAPVASEPAAEAPSKPVTAEAPQGVPADQIAAPTAAEPAGSGMGVTSAAVIAGV